ncbi:MAG: LysR family transcriptional regulator [bacterium]
MNWDDVKYFLAVAREGSISGGARKLGVQHSTLSRRLRALEKKLAVRLIERKKSGYVLTNGGEKLKKSALEMENSLLKVEGNLIGRERRLTGKLRITAINNMASTVLMPIFASFAKQYPDIDFHLLVSNLYASLAERESDIAIRLTNTPTETLIGKKLVTVASTVYASKNYLKQNSQSSQEPRWIGANCCGFHHNWTKSICPDSNHHFYSDDTLLTLAALKQDLGLAYLPCFLGDTDTELGRYCPPDPQHNLGLWLLYHPDLKRNARVLAFKSHIFEHIFDLKSVFNGTSPDQEHLAQIGAESAI